MRMSRAGAYRRPDLQGRQLAQIDRRIKANGQITEEAFLADLDYALENIWLSGYFTVRH